MYMCRCVYVCIYKYITFSSLNITPDSTRLLTFCTAYKVNGFANKFGIQYIFMTEVIDGL